MNRRRELFAAHAMQALISLAPKTSRNTKTVAGKIARTAVLYANALLEALEEEEVEEDWYICASCGEHREVHQYDEDGDAFCVDCWEAQN